jgi:hypothetical protein
MKRIEKHLLENRESITFSKPSDFTAESFQEYKNAHLKSSITVKRRKDVPDDFKYIISFDDEKECYWVEVLGGVAMVYEIHGPFSVSEILEICKGVGPRKVLGDEEE